MLKIRRRSKIEKVAVNRNMYKRDGISKLEQLKMSSFLAKTYTSRYDYFQMKSIIEHKLAIDIRRYKDFFESFDVNGRYGRRDDFWSAFQINMFWHSVSNDQTNRLYIGMDRKKIKKRLGREPTDEEMYIQLMFWRTFKHLTPQRKISGWINVDLWW